MRSPEPAPRDRSFGLPDPHAIWPGNRHQVIVQAGRIESQRLQIAEVIRAGKGEGDRGQADVISEKDVIRLPLAHIDDKAQEWIDLIANEDGKSGTIDRGGHAGNRLLGLDRMDHGQRGESQPDGKGSAEKSFHCQIVNPPSTTRL